MFEKEYRYEDKIRINNFYLRYESSDCIFSKTTYNRTIHPHLVAEYVMVTNQRGVI
jgi:hypothetical protein